MARRVKSTVQPPAKHFLRSGVERFPILCSYTIDREIDRANSRWPSLATINKVLRKIRGPYQYQATI